MGRARFRVRVRVEEILTTGLCVVLLTTNMGIIKKGHVTTLARVERHLILRLSGSAHSHFLLTVTDH